MMIEFMKPLFIFLNYFFFAFHTCLILFNCFGWIFKKTRPWNLATLGLTAFSWFVLGIWYGWGFCYCTEWHWRVREALGLPTPSNGYVQFLVYKITGIMFDWNLVNIVTVSVFSGSLAASLGLNSKDFAKWLKKRKGAGANKDAQKQK